MTDLTRDQRRALEAAIKAARDEAEIAAADALRKLGVADAEAPAHLDAAKRAQRNRLRAHARALGDARAANGSQAITRLTEQAAYVQWHRLLFARFLIERRLLREEAGAAVSLNDCREIAFGEGAGADEWSVAAGFAAAMLPGVFPADDPAESLVLAPEHARTLRQRLLGMDAAIFQAGDSLGWTYQFWRAAEKKAVNEAQVKIGAAELPAVTQLFTEPYMVRFLLHNTLGAWWAGKVLAGNTALMREAVDEAALRKACALPGYDWDFLRFVQEEGVWSPAAGTFPGWPTTAKALTVLDPCCGSGHFLTEALTALTALRAADERLTSADAVAAVLRENLAGLEIDGRCVQIAAFALALTAWRIGGPDVALPTLNVAWVGARPPLPKAEFAALANGDAELRRGLEALHDLFVQAPLLGSLIQPIGGDLMDPTRVARIENSLSALVEKMRDAEPERAEGAVAARGMADAAAILAQRWVLQATNVPFLGNGQQDAALSAFLAARFEAAKADLATAMLQRMQSLARPGGTVASVSPQTWLFLRNYKTLRAAVLDQTTFIAIGALGARAFETITGEVVSVILSIISVKSPDVGSRYLAIDANDAVNPSEKKEILLAGNAALLRQSDQKKNTDFTIKLVPNSDHKTIGHYANSWQGLVTGDTQRFTIKFWEVSGRRKCWIDFISSPDKTAFFEGRDTWLRWEEGRGALHTASGAHNFPPRAALGQSGVLASQGKSVRAAIYSGETFNDGSVPIIPKREEYLLPLLAFISDENFTSALRTVNRKLIMGCGYFLKVPFDLEYWQGVAGQRYPNGLPEPYSDDPTQWLFHGHPRHSEPGTELHVALARLAGYRWPAETDSSMRLSAEARARIAEAAGLPAADADGLLALTPLLGERALADRLRAFCIAAWGEEWQPGTEAMLVAAACDLAKDKRPAALTLDAWLRTHAARQHAKLFHDRPFLWWITDGRGDGFCAVAHYHRLTKDKLERLAFHMLGDHLTRLGDDPRAEAGEILQRKLARIVEGEAPYDIFVRWKSLHAQPMGWEPDLDDGVRLNIRPFIEAGVLAQVPNVKYTVDRGKDVTSSAWYGVFGSERRNDHHTTLAEKRAARAAKR